MIQLPRPDKVRAAAAPDAVAISASNPPAARGSSARTVAVRSLLDIPIFAIPVEGLTPLKLCPETPENHQTNQYPAKALRPILGRSLSRFCG
jgi:hypothetical protein